ncbi:hypothetical protein WJX73_001198 [Symbiochloris irregularis]|uniref:DNA mismatch repair protein MSH4 n=1 Tax=Symbiochloris irregularis TaxID=706552 RepID=A0AAW1P183_9CHLO
MVVRTGSNGDTAERPTLDVMETRLICAVLENRAKEVGVAALSLSSSSLKLLQFVECSRTYTAVTSALAAIQPSVLITVATDSNRLAQHVFRAAHAEDTPIAGKHFAAPDGPKAQIAAQVQAFILLRNLLMMLPTLTEVIDEVLDSDVQVQKVAFLNATQQCFAIKGNADGFLDLARAAFSRTTEDVHDLVAKYRADFELDALKVQYAGRRGFYLVAPLPGTTVKGSTEPAPELPAMFLELERKGRTQISCTTHELQALNTRLADALNDCLMLTAQVLQATSSRVLQHVQRLHCLTDNLALLDMLCAFASVATLSNGPYVRPKLTEAGPLAIVDGRHVLLENMEDTECQANDTYLASCSSFHVITGPNMSGKTTYLRQVALLVIMAQIGCFVPASFASIRIVDKLFTRMGTGDSIESNCSSFLVEMQEAAHITSTLWPVAGSHGWHA